MPWRLLTPHCSTIRVNRCQASPPPPTPSCSSCLSIFILPPNHHLQVEFQLENVPPNRLWSSVLTRPYGTHSILDNSVFEVQASRCRRFALQCQFSAQAGVGIRIWWTSGPSAPRVAPRPRPLHACKGRRSASPLLSPLSEGKPPGRNSRSGRQRELLTKKREADARPSHWPRGGWLARRAPAAGRMLCISSLVSRTTTMAQREPASPSTGAG